MIQTDDTPATGSDTPSRTRRWTGALPVTAAILLVALAAALLSPAIRSELAQSFVRQPDRYLELYFADQARARTCPATDGELTVVATVRSHLADQAALPYRVSVAGPTGAALTTKSGVVATTPGRAADFGATVPAPTTAYTVTVTFPGRTERLALHCAAGTD